MWNLSPKSYKTAFAVVFTILVGVGIASYVMSDRFATSEELVIHTHEVIFELKSVSADLIEAEDARRGFVMIGDHTLLIDFDEAVRNLPRHFDRVQALTADNPRQQQRTVELRPLIAARLALLNESIQLQRQDPSAAEKQSEFTREGVIATDKLRSLLDAMEQEENQLLHDRSRISAARQRKATMILVLAFLLASMTLVSLFLLMSAEVTRRTWAELQARENEKKYRLLVNGIQDHAVIRVDLEGGSRLGTSEQSVCLGSGPRRFWESPSTAFTTPANQRRRNGTWVPLSSKAM